MTPEQLERIKQDLTNYLFDRGHRISKPLIDDMVKYYIQLKNLKDPE